MLTISNRIFRSGPFLKELDPAGKGISSTDFGSVVNFLYKYSWLIGGVIATFLVIYGGITILTSGGSPEKVKEGQEIIVNALMGLALLLMAVVIVRTIGGTVLNLPGFNI